MDEIPQGAFVCKIDETQQELPPGEEAVMKAMAIVTNEPHGNVHDKVGLIFASTVESLAVEVIDMRETLTLGLYPLLMKKCLGEILSMIAYACEHPARRKRIPMDVNAMVKKWVPLIRKLAVAHDVDEKDQASSELDDYLLPVVGAPVAQIREFYRKLVAELKEDKTVPWAVWKLFEFWGENVLDKITKEQELQLKTEIAKRIAENSIAQIPREDWIASMIGALQWRSAERLQEIEENMEKGHKPRVRGKQSCLFLQVGEAEVML
jgi:hypothetical protein